MLRLVRILAVFALLNILACKSKKPEASQLKTVIQNGEQLRFSAKESRYFYDKIIDLGNKNGLNMSKNNSQKIRGMVHCIQDSAYKNCFFLLKKMPKYSDKMSLESIKIDIEKNFLLGETKLEDELSKKIWDYVVETRANIRFESDVVAELECNIETMDANFPKSENINCVLSFPRMSNQLMFGKNEAIIFANLLQGNEPYQNSNGSVNGQINCQWKTSEAQCVVSRISDRESGQNFNLLEKSDSFFVYSRYSIYSVTIYQKIRVLIQKLYFFLQ